MICTDNCVIGLDAVQLPDNCGDVVKRNEVKSKLLAFRCDVALPTGTGNAIADAIEAMINAKTLAWTGKLRAFDFADPETTDITDADCLPSYPQVTGRVLSFEDLNTYEVDDAGGASPYYDRDFWANLVQNRKWNWAFTTCDGQLYPLLLPDGTNWMTGILTAFRTDDKAVANQRLEMKKGHVKFLGDPLAIFPKPLINLSDYVVSNPLVAQLF